jgi:hypothetical protein
LEVNRAAEADARSKPESVGVVPQPHVARVQQKIRKPESRPRVPGEFSRIFDTRFGAYLCCLSVHCATGRDAGDSVVSGGRPHLAIPADSEIRRPRISRGTSSECP